MNFGVRRFRRLLFVSCAGFAVSNLMDVIDTVIAGHVLGETALGAIGLFWPVTLLLFFLASTVSTGCAILFSDAVGRFDRDRSDSVFSSGLFAVLGVSVVFAAGMWLLREPFFALSGAGAETLGLLRPYWNVFTLQVLAFPLSVYLSTMICADGNERICTCAFFVELAVNAVASLFLCRAYGTAGLAFGTVAGTLASLAILPGHFRDPGGMLRFRPRFSLRIAVEAFARDFPESCYLLFTGGMYVFMNAFLVSRFGDVSLTVMAAVITANEMMSFFYGVPKAVQPIVGVYLGEGNHTAVRTVMKDALKVSVMMGAALSTVLALVPDLPLMIIGVNSPDLVSSARHAVRIVAFSYVFFSVSALLSTYYLLIERTAYSLWIVVLQEALLPLAGCLAGAAVAELTGFWTGYALASPLALALFLVWARFRHRGLAPLFLSPEWEARTRNWTLELKPDRVCAVAAEVLRTFRELSGPSKSCARAAMLVEDTLMSTLERNAEAKRPVLAEVTLDLRDRPRILIRDDSVLFSLVRRSDVGFRDRMLEAVSGDESCRRSSVAVGFNRSVFDL